MSHDSDSNDELKIFAGPTGPSPDHSIAQKPAVALPPASSSVMGSGSLPDLSTVTSFDLAHFPPQDTIKLVAAYLGELIKASDGGQLLGGAKGDLTRFHARTVPAIDILAYLQRILRYAPCGNEVLLAIVVYFERLLRRAVLLLEAQKLGSATPKLQMSGAVESLEIAAARISTTSTGAPQLARRTSVTYQHTPSDSPAISRSASGVIAPTSPTKPVDQDITSPGVPASLATHPSLFSHHQAGVYAPSPPSVITMPIAQTTDPGLIEMAMAAIESTEFTMSKKRKKSILILSSFNIHRLLITGVMVGSKLFSDVFFLNSHYAKVGGLPVPELNWLELEFVIFNDFKLHVPLEELQEMGEFLLSKCKEPEGLRKSVESGERWRLDRSIPVEIQFLRQMQVSQMTPSASPTLASSPTPRHGAPFSPGYIHVPPRVPSPLANTYPQTPSAKAAADFQQLRISDESSHERAANGMAGSRWPRRDGSDDDGASGSYSRGQLGQSKSQTQLQMSATSHDGTVGTSQQGQPTHHGYIRYANMPYPRSTSPLREHLQTHNIPSYPPSYRQSPGAVSLSDSMYMSYPPLVIGTPVGPLPNQPHLYAACASTPPPPSAGLMAASGYFMPNGYFVDPNSPLRSPHMRMPSTPPQYLGMDRSHSVPLPPYPMWPPMPGVAMERTNSTDQPRKRAPSHLYQYEYVTELKSDDDRPRETSPGRNGSISRNGHNGHVANGHHHPYNYSPYSTMRKHKTPPVSPRRGSVGQVELSLNTHALSPGSQSSHTAITSPSDAGASSDSTIDPMGPVRKTSLHRVTKSEANLTNLDPTQSVTRLFYQ